MTDSVSEAGSSQGQAIHLQPDFCTVLCLRPTQPWVYSHLTVLIHSRLLGGMPALPHFRTGSFSSLSRLNFESCCWMRLLGIPCSHDAACCLSRAAVNTVTTHVTLRICYVALVNRNHTPLAGLRAGKVQAGRLFSFRGQDRLLCPRGHTQHPTHGPQHGVAREVSGKQRNQGAVHGCIWHGRGGRDWCLGFQRECEKQNKFWKKAGVKGTNRCTEDKD